MPWHELGTHCSSPGPRAGFGEVRGWRKDSGGYTSFTTHLPGLEQLGRCEISEGWTCDITDVDGLLAAKSPLRDFVNTDHFVEKRCPGMIDEITQAKLMENLSHHQVRICNTPGGDHFGRYLWDRRLFLMNSGGAHHFAAAKYIAARLPHPVPLQARLYTYSLNAQALALLRRDFEVFAVSRVWEGFFEAMETFGATWLSCPMSPLHFGSAEAVLLPKAERRSMKVASVLRTAGVQDLGAHLGELVLAQSADGFAHQTIRS